MPVQLDLGQIKAESRSLLRSGTVSPYKATALLLAITLVLDVIDAAVSYMIDTSGGLTVLSFSFVSILVSLISIVLNAGYLCYCLGIRRGEHMPYESLFDAFSFAGKAILLSIVEGIFIFLWSLLFVVPGIIAAYRYSFAMMNLCDNPGLGVMEALDLSKRQTLGWKLELFKLDLSYLGWNLLASLPSLYWDFKLYFQVLSDPYAVLTVSTSLTEILVSGIWALVVSLFYMPGWQCVMLDYFDAARAASSGGKAALPEEGPDDSEGF